ncbi:MAG: DUF481 domain-containing protein [Opitutales bacterium]|jgi:hypothetical protein
MRPAIALLLFPALLAADTATLKDGTFLRGRIERIVDGRLEMKVPLLGDAVHRIPLDSVESFAVDDEVRLSDGGPVRRGRVSAVGGRAVASGSSESVPLDARTELWRDAVTRPHEVLPVRKWTAQADLDVSGRSGATTGSGFSAGFMARGESAEDVITAGVRTIRTTAGTQIAADDLHAQLSYETNPAEVAFWYLRTDTGYDHARQVDFLTVNTVGLGFRVFQDPLGKLDLRTGVGHRYETYMSELQPTLSAPSADLGLLFVRDFGWVEWNTQIAAVPSLESWNDYYVRHETSLGVLRGQGPLSVRLGVTHDLRGNPVPPQVRLGTAYFMRLVYAWK